MLAVSVTFRSGVVEQLRIHAKRLGVPIFDRGYKKDLVVVARDVILKASTLNKS